MINFAPWIYLKTAYAYLGSFFEGKSANTSEGSYAAKPSAGGSLPEQDIAYAEYFGAADEIGLGGNPLNDNGQADFWNAF